MKTIKNNLSYVGYDLGCTVALESLELYESGKNNAGYYFDTITGNYVLMDLSNKPINTFVGLGCIGNFSYPLYQTDKKVLAPFADFIQDKSERFQDDEWHYYGIFDGHIPGSFYKSFFFIGETLTGAIVGKALKETKEWALIFISEAAGLVIEKSQIVISAHTSYFPSFFTSKISMDVYQDLINWMSSSVTIGKDVNISNVAIIQSTYTNNYNKKYEGALFEGTVYIKGTDKFVSDADQLGICKNINSNNKYYVNFENLPHFGAGGFNSLADQRDVQDLITVFLKIQSIESCNEYTILSDQTNCEG